MAIAWSGESGGVTGPHADVRIYRNGSWVDDPSPWFSRFLTEGGTPLNEAFEMTSPPGMRTHPIHGDQRMHYGGDFATPVGTPITFEGGRPLGYKFDEGGGGWMFGWQFDTDEGEPAEAWLLHAQEPGEDAPRYTGSPIDEASSTRPSTSGSRGGTGRYEPIDFTPSEVDIRPTAADELINSVLEGMKGGRSLNDVLGVAPITGNAPLFPSAADASTLFGGGSNSRVDLQGAEPMAQPGSIPAVPADRGALNGARLVPSGVERVRQAKNLRSLAGL
jgi:hypothetical protein